MSQDQESQGAIWVLPAVEALTGISASAAPLEYKLHSACAMLAEHMMAGGVWILGDLTQQASMSTQKVNPLGSELLDDEFLEMSRSKVQTRYQQLLSSMLPVALECHDTMAPVIRHGFRCSERQFALVAVPMVLAASSVGTILVLLEEPTEYADQDFYQLMLLARIVAMCVKSAKTPKTEENPDLMVARLNGIAAATQGVSMMVSRNTGQIIDARRNGVAFMHLVEKKDPLLGNSWVLQDGSEPTDCMEHDRAIAKAMEGESARCHVRIRLPASASGKNDSDVMIVEETFEPVKNAKSEVVEVIGFARDVTEVLRAQEAMRDLREKDPVTGCLMVNMFKERAGPFLENRSQEGAVQSVAVFSIEIDRAGTGSHMLRETAHEDLLMAVANRTRKHLGPLHLLARRSEHSFVAMVRIGDRNNPRHSAYKIVESLIQQLREPIVVGRLEHFLNVNVGYCIGPEDGQTVHELMMHADIAALHAQRQGRNRGLAFTREMAQEAHERSRIEARLHRAVDNEEFLMAFQPKVDLFTGEVCGAEALIRLHGQNAIAPGRFIPIAEECGLISYIGEWALRKSCETAKRWSDRGLRLPISVNVSTRQFHDNDFHAIVREVLEDTQCPPELIEIEVTEGVMFTDPSAAILSFSILKEIGVGISIDDFGMGFSSLSYLKSLPADAVKIDRTFISGLPGDSDNAAITKAIIAMARAMNMSVVAEGVEDIECLRYLRGLHCHIVQGYYFSKPLFEGEFLEWHEAYQSAFRLELVA